MSQLTQDQLIKALTNADIFISNYCYIEVTGKGLQLFKLYEYQEQALDLYANNRSIFILKSRQMGFTTLAAAYALWLTLTEGNNVLFLSKKEDDAMDIVRKVRIMYQNLPDALKQPIISSNATTVEFSNKNRIQSLPATERSGAGKSASLIIMDEFSAFPSAKGSIAGADVWTSILPTISTGGRVIVQSTAKGMGNKFYEVWAGENKFTKKVFHWSDHPVFGKDLYKRETPEDGYGIYSSPWADELMPNMTPDGWAQEFNCDFVQSGRPVFDWYKLKLTEKSKEDRFGRFVCGVDLASGQSKDWHVAQIINVDTGRQVETLRSQDPIDVFGEKVRNRCEFYNNALLAFENNSGYGLAFMKNINDYPNLYYQLSFDKRTQKRTRKLGWNTNVKTKELMITDLNLAIINEELSLIDETTIQEMKTYQYDDNDKMNAMAGMNDDCVTSLAIAWQAAKSMNKQDILSPVKGRFTNKFSPSVDYDGLIPVEDGLFYADTSVTDWRVA